MLFRSVILCLTLALLAPLASAKKTGPAKPNRGHHVRSKKAKITSGAKGPKAKWGSAKLKTKHKS
jgi:hypothetical protein